MTTPGPFPESFLTRGMEIEIAGRTYTIVGSSAWSGLHVVPEFRRHPGDDREPDITEIQPNDPRISVSFYSWNNRARAVRWLETERYVWAYPLLDGPGRLKSDPSRRAITEAMRRALAGEPAAIGVLSAWDGHRGTEPQYDWDKRRAAAGEWDGSEWTRSAAVCRWDPSGYVATARGPDNYWHRMHGKSAWSASWKAGPSVRADGPGQIPQSPFVYHKGDAASADGAKAAADAVLAPHWILL